MAAAKVGPSGGLVGPAGGLVGPEAGTSAAADFAAGTGTAYDTAMRYAPAEIAGGTGVASDASIDTGSGAANAEIAAGTGTASGGTTYIAPVIAATTGIGAAGVAAASVAASAGLASGTGIAYNPRLPTQQLVVFDLGGTWASQAVVFDITAPFTLSVQPVSFDILGFSTASQAVVFDLGETGTVASQAVVFDILDETDGQAITSGVYVDASDPSTPGAFLAGIQVYSKAGLHLGAMIYTTFGPRPKSISTWQGVHANSMTVTVPRKVASTSGNFIANPDLTLIAEDRILVIGSSFGLEPWAGSIDTVEWTDGAAILSVQDLYGQLATALIRDTAAVKTRTGTPVSALASLVMGHANTWLGANGEVQWEFDGTGSLTFFGDDTLSGDILSILGKIARQSFAEFCWDVRVLSDRMVPILVWRDAFSAGAGVALTDGASGNVRANPSYSTSVTQLVNAVRLVGSVTRIESLIPPGAKALPVQEVIPVAEVWLPTGTYRRRTNLSLSAPVTLFVEVPYSLPDESQQEAADAAAAAMRELFKTFIRAVHDQYGRPWHDGWSWAGPGPEDEDSTEPNATVNLVPERVLHLRDYVHWLHLSDGPRAIVMKHRSLASYVRVSYDRVNAIQKVARFSVPGDVDPATVFDFEWRRMPEWDPRRDGVGKEVEVRTVIAGAVRTLLAWRLVPYGQGDQDFSTQLAYGITADAVNLPVVNAFGFPPAPFDAKIGGDEWVRVTSISGNVLTVIRGQLNTTASIHEVGEEVAYEAPASAESDVTEQVTDQLPPIEVPWPDGIAYANALLAKWSVPSRLLTVQLANIGGDWATVATGSTHTLDLQTEGPSAGVTGTVRVVGFAPDDVVGTMELLVEVQ